MSLFAILWIICGPINFYLSLRWIKKDSHYLDGEDILTACFFALLGISGLLALIVVNLIDRMNVGSFDFWKSMDRMAKYLDNKFFS